MGYIENNIHVCLAIYNSLSEPHSICCTLDPINTISSFLMFIMVYYVFNFDIRIEPHSLLIHFS